MVPEVSRGSVTSMSDFLSTIPEKKCKIIFALILYCENNAGQQLSLEFKSATTTPASVDSHLLTSKVQNWCSMCNCGFASQGAFECLLRNTMIH